MTPSPKLTQLPKWIAGTVVAFGLLAASGPAASRDVKDETDRLVETWSQRHRGKAGQDALNALIAAVSEAVPEFAPDGPHEDPRMKGLRALTPEPPKKASGARGKRKTKATKGPKEARAFPLPMNVEYRFGLREPVSIAPKNSSLASAVAKGVTLADLPPEAGFEAILHGCVPGTELALAAIEQRLDVLEGADAYARFLDEWRNTGPNGDESFYEALDRTAGTGEEVFFFDAMLADFVGRFAREEGKRWNLQQRHDNNQNSFLAYRQYRGMIEAVALALVLPPDVEFPKRLERYDYGSVTLPQFALRHQIDILTAAKGGDVDAVIRFVRDFFEKHPLPENLWDGYECASMFTEAFQPEVKQAVDRSVKSAVTIFEESRDARLALAKKIRDAVETTLQGTGDLKR